MFSQHDFYQSDPDVVAMVMTQLSLKAGLKASKRNEAAAHARHVQAYALARTVAYPAPDGAGVSHVSQEETRRKDKG
jgi:hypothetical protein